MRASGKRVLEPQAGPSLLGRLDLAALALRAGGVRHGVGFVEDDHAVEGVAVVLVQRPGEPPAPRWRPASPACGAARPARRRRCSAFRARNAGGTGRRRPRRLRRRPSRPRRPRRPIRRRRASWHPGGLRHRATGRLPGPAAGFGPPRTGHRPSRGASLMGQDRWRRWEEVDAQARPAPDGRRAWLFPCWNGGGSTAGRRAACPPAPRRRPVFDRLAGLRPARRTARQAGGSAARRIGSDGRRRLRAGRGGQGGFGISRAVSRNDGPRT